MMSRFPPSDHRYRREMGDGLVARWSTGEDTERLAALYSVVFRAERESAPNARIAAWTRDLKSGRHPLIDPADFALVEDTRTGAIVAATCLLVQEWDYAGITIPVGRPELVATAEDYRNRGLIRAIFALIHARSAAYGHLAQGITGIPYYYRQFGYEYALDLGGNRDLPFSALPPLAVGATERYALRAAAREDAPLLRRIYDRERAPALVSTRIDERYWDWALGDEATEPVEGFRARIIVDGDGRPVGSVLHSRWRERDTLNIWALAVEPTASLVAVAPSALRHLREGARDIPAEPDAPPPTGFGFGLSPADPVFEALGDLVPPAHVPPYAWYVRVPDLPALIRRVAPVLERRLATSVATGYSGETRLDFYRGGLRLVFVEGRLTEAADWRAAPWDKAQAGFPPLVFLQLLFGRRGLDDLRHAFPDVWVDDGLPLLRALFPARPSWVLPLD